MTVGFYIDQDRCTGCRACQVACKDKNRLEVGVLYREAHTYSVGSYPNVRAFSHSFSCNHCEAPICMANCPQDAIFKAEDGTVIQDATKCIGCQTCVNSCPYGHPKYIAELKVAGKCDGCYGLRAAGSDPACVAGCPNRALFFGEIEDLKARFGTDLDNGTISVLPDNTQTMPNILINAKECAFASNAIEINW